MKTTSPQHGCTGFQAFLICLALVISISAIVGASLNVVGNIAIDRDQQQIFQQHLERNKVAEDKAMINLCTNYRRWEELAQDRVESLWQRCSAYPLDNK